MSGADPGSTSRRTFLGSATAIGMGGGLLASYGTFFVYAGRYLYPSAPPQTAWLYVTRVADLKVGQSLNYRTPAGVRIVITRKATRGVVEDFLALSSTCPHLGCQVRWEAGNNRFFCPCHNGVFDPEGYGTEGPPKGQSLLRYPLKIDQDLLFIEVPVERVAAAPGLAKPGHDGCLGEA